MEKPDAHSAPTLSSVERQYTHANHPLETKSLRCSILSARETPNLWTEERASENCPEASTQMQEGHSGSWKQKLHSTLAGGSCTPPKCPSAALPTDQTTVSGLRQHSLDPSHHVPCDYCCTARWTSMVINYLHICFLVLNTVLPFLLFITLNHPQAGLGACTWLQVCNQLSKVTKAVKLSRHRHAWHEVVNAGSGFHWAETSQLHLFSHPLYSWLISFLYFGSLVRWGDEESSWNSFRSLEVLSVKIPLKIQRSNKEHEARYNTILHPKNFHRVPTMCKSPTRCQLLYVW